MIFSKLLCIFFFTLQQAQSIIMYCIVRFFSILSISFATNLHRNEPKDQTLWFELFFGQLLVKFEEFGDTTALGHCLHIESVGLHHGAVVVLVGAAQLRGHSQFVV